MRPVTKEELKQAIDTAMHLGRESGQMAMIELNQQLGTISALIRMLPSDLGRPELEKEEFKNGINQA